jgi:hypothetical protein
MAHRSVRALKGGMAILVGLMLSIAIVSMIYVPMPQENREMLMALIGCLVSNFTTVMNNLFPNVAARGTRATDP